MTASFQELVNGLEKFLNRGDEIKVFTEVLEHPDQRILLLDGPVGSGKTALVRELKRMCTGPGTQDTDERTEDQQPASTEERTIATILNFRTGGALDEPGDIIESLRDALGGSFDDQMDQLEDYIYRHVATPEAAGVGAAESPADAQPAETGGGSGGVTFTGESTITIGGDVVGRDKIIIQDSDVVVDPSAGKVFDNARIERRRNRAFRRALRDFQAEKKVVLFFDHYENTVDIVKSWFQKHLLDLYQTAADEFPNLWILVAGTEVPLRDQEKDWQGVLRSVYINHLSVDNVLSFWVEELGLEEIRVDTIIKTSGGSTKVLYLNLRNFVNAIR